MSNATCNSTIPPVGGDRSREIRGSGSLVSFQLWLVEIDLNEVNNCLRDV